MKIEEKPYTISRTFLDFPSDDGDAVIVFLHGCSHGCKGCHSPSLQEYVEVCSLHLLLDDIIDMSNRFEKTRNVVFSGGDPLYNIHTIKQVEYLCNELHERGYKICIYTGHDIEYVKNYFTGKFDFVKCGCYIEEERQQSGKDDEGMTLASKNQNFYDNKFKKISKDGRLVWRKKWMNLF